MIQRIQSIFLLIASAAGLGVLAFPFAGTTDNVQSSSLFADKVFSTSDNIGLLVLFAVAGALSIAAIFLFKNRLLQIKIGRVAFATAIIGMLLAAGLYFQDISNVENNQVNVGIGAFLPMLCVLFLILAIRAIKKDEALVKSADRLR